MDDSQLKVRFWGVRGSHPVPGKHTIQFGGNTSCVEVRAGKHIIILDAGTGIIELGQKLMREMLQSQIEKPMTITLIFSHTHHDHILGLPYFAPAYHENFIINCFGPRVSSYDIGETLALNLAPQFSPIELNELSADFNFDDINENKIIAFSSSSDAPRVVKTSKANTVASNEVAITAMKNYSHPKIGTYLIKITLQDKTIVYATDTEGYIGGDLRLGKFAMNANLLIHDAQYTPGQYPEMQGFGHSTYEMAADIAKTSGVEQLVLFHHDPRQTDEELTKMEKSAKSLFSNTTVAYEGQEFSF